MSLPCEAGPATAPAPPAEDRWTAWDRFLETAPGAGFMQSSWWADFRTTTGYDHFGVTIKDRGAVIGGAVVQRYSYSDESCFYYVPEGPALPSDPDLAHDVFDGVLDEIGKRRQNDPQTVSHLRIEPRWTSLPAFVSGFQPVTAFSDSYVEPRDTLCIDLRLTEPEILAQMKQKGRYNVRVAQRHGVTVVEDGSERGLKDFLRIYDETTSRQGLHGKPVQYFETLLAILTERRCGSMFFAEYGGSRIACALVVYFGSRATYFFGASSDTDRHVMAPYLLHFEAMLRARARGHEWYDFWGIAPSAQTDHPWDQISAFKRKFGGHEVNLVPTLDYIFDPGAYRQYQHR